MDPELKPEQEAEAAAKAELDDGLRPKGVIGRVKTEKPDEHVTSFGRPRVKRLSTPETSSDFAPTRLRSASEAAAGVFAPPSAPEADVEASGADVGPVSRMRHAVMVTEAAERLIEQRKASRRGNQRILDKGRRSKEREAKKAEQKVASVSKSGLIEKAYREEMAAKFPTTRIASWNGKGYGVKMRSIACNIVDACDGDQAFAVTCVRYVVRKWDDINERYLKGKGSAPDLTFLQGFFSKLHIEAQAWHDFAGVEKEWKDWKAAHPDEFEAPSELQSRYETARSLYEKGVKKG